MTKMGNSFHLHLKWRRWRRCPISKMVLSTSYWKSSERKKEGVDDENPCRFCRWGNRICFERIEGVYYWLHVQFFTKHKRMLSIIDHDEQNACKGNTKCILNIILSFIKYIIFYYPIRCYVMKNSFPPELIFFFLLLQREPCNYE